MQYEASQPSFLHISGMTAGVFFLCAVFLHSIDLVPEVVVEAHDADARSAQETPIREIDLAAARANGVAQSEARTETPAYTSADIRPVRVIVQSADISVGITSPASTDVDVLDRALLSGAVQYPTGAMLGENGNVLLLAHSSYLPVVHNQAFKAFNGLGDVRVGDTVSVFSKTYEFVYTVHESYRAHADEATIAFEADVPMLTLATCNAFGGKEDRFIVHATLTNVRPVTT
jgi:sortase (surface protein transpeptidase)